MFKEPFVSRKYFATVGNFGHGKNFRARSYFGSSSMVFGGRPFSLLLSLLRFPKLVALLLLPHYPIAVPNCDRSHCQTYSVEKHERLKIEKRAPHAWQQQQRMVNTNFLCTQHQKLKPFMYIVHHYAKTTWMLKIHQDIRWAGGRWWGNPLDWRQCFRMPISTAKQKSSTWKVVRRRPPLQLIFWHIWVSLRFDLPRKKWVSFWININFWIIY